MSAPPRPVPGSAAQPTEPGRPVRPARTLDILLRIAGGAMVTWAAVLLALVEAFLSPMRVFGVRLPVSLLLAVVGNLALIWLMRWLTGNRPAALLPGLTWFAVLLPLSNRTTDGDVILAGNNWVSLALLLIGAAAAAVGAYVMVAPKPVK